MFCKLTAATEIVTLSLHDALPISGRGRGSVTADRARGDPPRRDVAHRATDRGRARSGPRTRNHPSRSQDRKSTRLNSSHPSISYAVFCLKKKKQTNHVKIWIANHT